MQTVKQIKGRKDNWIDRETDGSTHRFPLYSTGYRPLCSRFPKKATGMKERKVSNSDVVHQDSERCFNREGRMSNLLQKCNVAIKSQTASGL